MMKWLISAALSCLIFPATAGTQAPNILFAIADDWGMHAGVYGTPWIKTPNFDRVANEGLLFQNAYTPNAKCAPSRACIITGRNSWQLEAAANHWCHFPAKFKTWSEALNENGWHVGHTNKGWAPGIARDSHGKPRQLTGKAYNQHRAQPPAKQMSNNDYASNFDDFLNANTEGKPWIFWYGAGEPHRNYEFGASLEKNGRKVSDIDKVPGYWPDNKVVRTDMLDYAFEVEHFDDHLGRMLASLEKRGMLENTLVIVTSDHGMPFPRCKGSGYDDSNHVPLAAMWPKGIHGKQRIIDDSISLIDLAPTFIELAGLEWYDTGMAPSSGKSLTNVFKSNQSGQVDPDRDHVLIGKERHDIGRPNDQAYPIRGIVKSSMLYLENFKPDRWPAGNPETGYLNTDGGATKTEILQFNRQQPNTRHWQLCFGKRPPAELYDLKEDPECIRNLVDNPDLMNRRDAMRRLMHQELLAQKDPRMLGNGNIFDNYLYADPARRRFHERYMDGEKIKTGWVNPSDFEKKTIQP